MRARRISSGEAQRTRKDSASSVASDASEDLDKGLAPLEDDITNQVITLNRVEPVAVPVVQVPSKQPRKDVPRISSVWNNMFPDLTNSLAAVDINDNKNKMR